jgi:hypothetical protein
MTADIEIVRELADECRPILEGVARREDLITYGDLADIVRPKVGLRDLNARDSRLIAALGEVSKVTYARDGFLLSVVVVNAGSNWPDSGFFWLARKGLGVYPSRTTNEDVFQRETKDV